MREQLIWVRWVVLAVGVAVLVVFLIAQHQSVNFTYGQSPSERDAVMDRDPVEQSDHEIPSASEIAELFADSPFVRLPGAVAHWDETLVADALDGDELRILVAPPGISAEQKSELDDVDGVDIMVVGTNVSSGFLASSHNNFVGWRNEYATGDVTNLVLSLIAAERDENSPPDVDVLDRRDATESELAVVAADLRSGRLHIADGARFESVPAIASEAFPDSSPLLAVFPRQDFGEAMPDYGQALAEQFPHQPLLVMYGDWIEYYGPQADDFAEVAAASFYAQFGNRLSRWDYPQQNVMNAYLNRVTDIRYSGVFGRPLPYQPFDPLRVALPALPWLFGACVLVFLAMSLRPIIGTQSARTQSPRTAPARLAHLNALAVEVAGLSYDPSLVRGIHKLGAASEAIYDGLPQQHIDQLIARAHHELDETARKLGREDLRPQNYIAGGEL